ncbi:RagB/SusD family nutrient uptake outer membrane protein [Maribellus sediminis]|uniref:RagB/SusD family nutrient uptake outer membrane protein n=1 Tax=Maribellus sediminis TaxID=2696285 RepID=UPI00142F5765|nr:RagB/SusD family nutrient uptake outer membrane protein [Maribellus sediminis]
MKKIFYSLLITLGLLGSQSCTSLLDQEPITITHPDVFWVSQSNAEQALAGSYSLLKYAITYQSNFLFWGEFTGMTFMDSQNWIVDYIEGSGNYVLAYRDGSRNWKDLYRAANWAMTIESYVEGMTEDMFDSPEEQKRIIGEAAFVRALTYFYIARIWGEAPIVTESIESSDQLITDDGYVVRIPRSSEKEVLDYALSAVEKAIANLEYSNPGDPSWAIQANKASAEALKAHLTLWYSSRDNDNSEMLQACVDAATSVINNSGASLIDYVTDSIDGYEDMCWGQSKTGLFEINVDASMNESFRMSDADAYYTGLTLNYPIWKNKNTNKAPKMNPDFYGNEFMAQNPDYANDARKALFFYEYSKPDDSFVTKYALQSPDPNSEDPYAQFSESNILIFRLADMYLLRAEALAKQGKGTQAVQDLNEIRSKAGVLPYTGATDRASMMKAIFDERAIEFVGEGQSGFDRIRMDYYYEGVPWMNVDRLSKKGYFWPIHPNVISVNPSIVQTEYWRGKV